MPHNCSTVLMGDSGTMQQPARSVPMMISKYSIEVEASTATLSPCRRPTPSSALATRLARRLNSPRVTVLSSQTIRRRAGSAAANRATASGMASNFAGAYTSSGERNWKER